MSFAANRSKLVRTVWDLIPISPSATKNVFGDTYNPSSGLPVEARRACDVIWADSVCTITCITAAGRALTGVALNPGLNNLAVIQVSACSGTVWAGVST